MTSTLATNYVSSKLSRKHFLETTKEGYPLQNQVPRTIESYTGNGNTTIPLTFKDIHSIDTALVGGVLTLDCSAGHNYFRRQVAIESSVQIANNIVVNYGTGNFIRAGYSDLFLPTTITIPAGTPPFRLNLDFIDRNYCHASFASGYPTKAPDFLSVQIAQNVVNDINSVGGQNVLWEPTSLLNSSSLTPNIGAGGFIESFTVAKAGFIEVNCVMSPNGHIASEFIAYLRINGVSVFQGESVLGLGGHHWACSRILQVFPNDVISIFSANIHGVAAVWLPTQVESSLSIKYVN